MALIPPQAVLRGTRASSAHGEVAAGQTWGRGVGGLWASLMLYSKKAIVAGAVFANGTSSIPVRPIGPASVPTRLVVFPLYSPPLQPLNSTPYK